MTHTGPLQCRAAAIRCAAMPDFPDLPDRMQELRRDTKKADHPVPDSDEQRAVLRCPASRAA